MEDQIQLKEDELFGRWKKEIPTEFAYDGVVSPKIWTDVNKKTIFLLKETNDCFDLRSHLYGGGKANTWANIGRWQYGIQNSESVINWNDVKEFGKNRTKRKEQLHQICAINLKKQPGGSTTKRKELEEAFFKDNLKYFSEQLSLYNEVKFIICCGRDVKNILFHPDVFKECFKYEYKEGEGNRYNDVWVYKLKERNTYVISYRHPCIYGFSEPSYKKLVIAIKELETESF